MTPDRIAWMRAALDAAATGRRRPVLAVTLPAVLGVDRGATSAAARAYLQPYLRAPNYQASLAAMGFGSADWEPPYSERVVDALVACGDEAALRARVAEMHAHGADHVAVIPLDAGGEGEDMAVLEALAPRG